MTLVAHGTMGPHLGRCAVYALPVDREDGNLLAAVSVTERLTRFARSGRRLRVKVNDVVDSVGLSATISTEERQSLVHRALDAWRGQ